MSYALTLKPSAEKQLKRLLPPLRQRILGKLAALQEDPRTGGATKLGGASTTYRVRVGDYRIVYEIDNPRQMVFVTIIAHRREVYRGM